MYFKNCTEVIIVETWYNVTNILWCYYGVTLPLSEYIYLQHHHVVTQAADRPVTSMKKNKTARWFFLQWGTDTETSERTATQQPSDDTVFAENVLKC